MENSEATRAALLESATAQFAENGYVGTSLDDIASATRMTRGAVYHHFDSKRDLYEAVLDKLESDIDRTVTSAAADTSNAWEAAFAALNAFLDRCSSPTYGRVVMLEGPIALGWERWRECEAKYAYGIVETFIRQLIDSGLMAPKPVELATRMIFGMLQAAGVAIAEAAPADRPRIKAEAMDIITRLLSGVILQPDQSSG